VDLDRSAGLRGGTGPRCGQRKAAAKVPARLVAGAASAFHEFDFRKLTDIRQVVPLAFLAPGPVAVAIEIPKAK
jgi:hypothetical protein